VGDELGHGRAYYKCFLFVFWFQSPFKIARNAIHPHEFPPPCLRYEVLELNASDVRSKGKLQDVLMGAAMCGAIGMDAKANKKRVIIMDEVDGMGGNEDRGGVQELLSVIKKAKVPFICICNDRQHQKIRSLAAHCFDLRLRRPTKQVGCDDDVNTGCDDWCWSS